MNYLRIHNILKLNMILPWLTHFSWYFVSYLKFKIILKPLSNFDLYSSLGILEYCK